MSFWDKVAGIYDITESLNGKGYKSMLRGVKQIVPEGAKVLDCAAGTGILRGAKIAESGVLTITNADSLSDGLILPLTLPESIDGANLKNWTVVVDGKKGAFCVSLDADGTVKLLKTGMMLIIR